MSNELDTVSTQSTFPTTNETEFQKRKTLPYSQIIEQSASDQPIDKPAAADSRKKETDRLSAIHSAVLSRNPAIVKTVLQAGANPDTKTGIKGSTPLIMAIDSYATHTKNEKDLEIIKTLLDAGANANLSDTEGTAPLIAAIHTKDAQLVDLLLSNGAKVTNQAMNAAAIMKSSAIIVKLVVASPDIISSEKRKVRKPSKRTKNGISVCTNVFRCKVDQDLPTMPDKLIASYRQTVQPTRLLGTKGRDSRTD